MYHQNTLKIFSHQYVGMFAVTQDRPKHWRQIIHIINAHRVSCCFFTDPQRHSREDRQGQKKSWPSPSETHYLQIWVKSLRSRSIERWPSGPCRGTPSPLGVKGSSPKARRGSEAILVQSSKVEGSSSQSSPTTAERPRARFAKGVAECGKETNTRYFFFRVLLDSPPPSPS